MLATIWTFIRSFYSPDLYSEVAHKNSNFGFNYLFAVSFSFSVIALIITVILSIFFTISLDLYVSAKIASIPAVNYILGEASLIVLIFLKLALGIILAAIGGVIFGIIICILSYFTAIPGKIFSALLMAKLEYASIRQIATYSYLPAAIIFWGIIVWLGLHDKFNPYVVFLKPYHDSLSSYLSSLPQFAVNIIIILGVYLAPLPIWILYIFYGIICAKISFMRLSKKRGAKSLSKVIR